jgi:hypothetical protein
MNLLTLRTFVSGGQDAYGFWFWRHPPLYHVLLLLARPLSPGLDLRAEWVSILSGAAGLAALYLLNARFLGRWVAAASCILLALMPGANFYDVWIKQDVLVIPLGLAAVWFFLRERPLPAGVCLGVAFLAKEMAIFYAGALCLLWLAAERERRAARDLVIVVGLALALAGWWYALFSASVVHFLSFATGLPGAAVENWSKPWTYYFAKLPRDLGWPGLVLAAAGVVALGRIYMKEKARGALWPLALVGPALVLLSALENKTPWFAIVLSPGWCTLQAAGLAALWRGRAWARSGAVVLAAGALAWPLVRGPLRNYEEYLRREDPGMWWGARASREAALALNDRVQDGERALVTPMHYWAEDIRIPCPIFVYYLESMPVLVLDPVSAADLVAAVRSNRLQWAMLSPKPGEQEMRWMRPLVREHGLQPVALQGAYIVDVSPLLEPSPSPPR